MMQKIGNMMSRVSLVDACSLGSDGLKVSLWTYDQPFSSHQLMNIMVPMGPTSPTNA